jgi:GT2 family glycosyltransferase
MFQIDVATETLDTLLNQGTAVGTETTPKIKYDRARVFAGKPYEGAIVSSRFSRKSRLIEVVSGASSHLPSGIINALMVNRQNELIRSLRKQLEATEKELANQKWVFDQFMKSPSWRMTYPVRWLAKQLRTLRDWLTGKPSPALATPAVDEPAESGDGEIPDASLDLKEFFTNLYRIQLQSFLTAGSPLQLPQSESPELSVILVLYNRAELTLACLRSLAENFLQRMEIIIVDNASQDETPHLLDHLRGVKIIRNKENRNFLLGVNQAARLATGEYLLILNNDAQVLPGTLQSALQTIRNGPDIGAVGGRLILLDGTLQEAGSIIWRDGSCLGYGRGDNPFAPMYMFRRDVDYCSGAFLLTPRMVWEQAAGFDESFKPAYYEETDYCTRLWERGLRVVYDPNSVLLHYEFASSDSAKAATDLQRNHQKIFAARHQALLAKQHRADANSILPARMKDRGRRKVLFIDDRVPHSWLGSGFPRSRTLLLSLLKQNCFVTFYPFDAFDERWSSVYADMPGEIEFMVGYGPPLLEPFLRNRQGYYDTIFISRPHNMKMLKPIRELHSDWFKTTEFVYDAEAIFATREITLRELGGNPLSKEEADALFQEEVDLAAPADCVIAVSESDADTFRKHGIENVCVVGHALQPCPTPRSFSERQGFLFVGAIHEEASPNGDSMIWFLEQVLPKIQAHLGPDVQVTIAGVNSSERIRQLAGPSVSITGHVNDLTSLYDAARIFIAPTRYSAGIPHKVHEAAAHGVPVVATPLLARQLGWRDGDPFLVGEDADSFAAKCAQLYRDESLWTALRTAAVERIRTECSSETFEENIARSITAEAQRHRGTAIKT